MKVMIQQSFLLERASKGISMRELSKRAHVTIGTISRAEKGHSISIKSAYRLCKALEKEFDQLFKIEVKDYE